MRLRARALRGLSGVACLLGSSIAFTFGAGTALASDAALSRALALASCEPSEVRTEEATGQTASYFVTCRGSPPREVHVVCSDRTCEVHSTTEAPEQDEPSARLRPSQPTEQTRPVRRFLA